MKSAFNTFFIKGSLIGLLFCINSSHAETIAPPQLGQETKGTPATIDSVETSSDEAQAGTNTKSKTQSSSEFTSKEYRRENGQVYRLELQHPNTPNQYIDQTGSEGNIESTDNDIEDTPNLPKWKLGSW